MRYAGIDTRQYTAEQTLFFIRIKGAQQFFDAIYGQRAMQSLFGHIANRHTLSEYRNAEHVVDLGSVTVADLTPADYAVYYACVHEDLPAIIARCRGLRSIPLADAKDLILRMVKWADGFFGSHAYRLFVFHIIDSYVVDILCRVAAHRGVALVCLSEWFIEPYRRHTIHGELHQAREVSDAELDEAVAYFANPRRAYWLDGVDRRNRLKWFAYLYLRYLTHWWGRYFLRFRLLGNRAYEYQFANVWKVRFRDVLVGSQFGTITAEELTADPDRFVLIPLHTFPEANVDYWMSDYRHADYYTSLYEVLSFFREQGKTVLLKEHPGFIYQRSVEVYRTLNAFGNVRLIDPYSPSSRVLDQVSLVVVWHGTMGIEAVMQGRRVTVFDSNYYSDRWLLPYRRYREALPLSVEERRRFLHRILQGTERV